MQDFFDEWADGYEFAESCKKCEKLRNIYGNYKDPDDEWNAIESTCCGCEEGAYGYE